MLSSHEVAAIMAQHNLASVVEGNPQWIIYGLFHPQTNELRYVGKAVNGLRRAQRHNSPCELKYPSHKNNWIKNLHAKGLKPRAAVLVVCSSPEDCVCKEIQVIRLCRSAGARLTNMTNGGDGLSGFRKSDETKRRMSESMKRYVAQHPVVPYRRTKKSNAQSSRSAKERFTRLDERVKISIGRGCRPIREIKSGKIYRTNIEACVALGLYRSAICHVLAGRQAHTHGYIFEYAE